MDDIIRIIKNRIEDKKVEIKVLEKILVDLRAPKQKIDFSWSELKKISKMDVNKPLNPRKKRKKSKKVKWTEADKDTLMEYRLKGLSFSKIGKKLNRTTASVAGTFARLNKK